MTMNQTSPALRWKGDGFEIRPGLVRAMRHLTPEAND